MLKTIKEVLPLVSWAAHWIQYLSSSCGCSPPVLAWKDAWHQHHQSPQVETPRAALTMCVTSSAGRWGPIFIFFSCSAVSAIGSAESDHMRACGNDTLMGRSMLLLPFNELHGYCFAVYLNIQKVPEGSQFQICLFLAFKVNDMSFTLTGCNSKVTQTLIIHNHNSKPNGPFWMEMSYFYVNPTFPTLTWPCDIRSDAVPHQICVILEILNQIVQ